MRLFKIHLRQITRVVPHDAFATEINLARQNTTRVLQTEKLDALATDHSSLKRKEVEAKARDVFRQPRACFLLLPILLPS